MSPHSSSVLKYSPSQLTGVRLLRLNRPERGNALSLEALEVILSELHQSECQALILTGSGNRFFCSGGDLTDYSKIATKKAGLEVHDEIRRGLKKIAESHKPKVALLNGDCLGGGTELASCFDQVIAAPHLFYGFWQGRQDLSFGWGGFARLSKRASEQRIKNLIQSGVSLSSYQAAAEGLIDEVAPFDRLLSRALNWLSKNLSRSLESRRSHRQLGLKSEKEIFEELWGQPSHQEKLNTWAKKS